MTGKRAIIGATLFAALGFGLVMAQDRQPDLPRSGDLGGRYLWYKSRVTGLTRPSYLEGAEVRQVGDRWFLTGRNLDETPGYRRGMKIWVPLEEVGTMVAFDDIDWFQTSGKKQEAKTTPVREVIRAPLKEIKLDPPVKVQTPAKAETPARVETPAPKSK